MTLLTAQGPRVPLLGRHEWLRRCPAPVSLARASGLLGQGGAEQSPLPSAPATGKPQQVFE